MVLGSPERLGQEYTDGDNTAVADMISGWTADARPPVQSPRYNDRLSTLLSERVTEANKQGEGETTIIQWFIDHPLAFSLVLAASTLSAFALPEILQHVQA